MCVWSVGSEGCMVCVWDVSEVGVCSEGFRGGVECVWSEGVGCVCVCVCVE